jgi:RNA polymerase sigma-70 factor, ECF subfamily
MLSRTARPCKIEVRKRIMTDMEQPRPGPEGDDQGRGGTVAGLPDDLTEVREVLRRAVRRVCPGFLEAQQEDIVQSALLRVVEISSRSEHGGIRSASYLWRAAHSATVDEIRRAGRRREVSLDDSTVAEFRSSATPDPEHEMRGRQIGRAVRECLAGLIRPRRTAVMLYLYGFEGEETRRVLGGNLKQTRNLTYRGLADLRRCLEGKGIRP